MATPSDRLVMVVLTLLSCGVYLNTFSAGFTFDDNFAVINNGDVTDAARPVWHLFTSDFWGQNIRSEQSHKSYRPLTVLSLRLQKQLSAYLPARTPLVDTGSQLVPHDNSDGLDPRPFHIANMLMHALVTLLVYRLAYQLCRAQDPAQGDGTRADAASRVEALIAGLLFACHPIHTEAVAGIVGHAELLAAAFAVSALLAYMQAAECGQRQHVYSNRLAGGGSRQHSAAKQQGSPGPLVPLQEANHMRHWALVAAAVLLTWAAALSKEIGITIAAAMVLYDAFLVPMPVEAQQQPLSSAASAIRSTRRSARLRGIVRSLWRRHQTWRMALMAVVVLIYVKGRAWLAGDHLVRIFRKVENPIPFAPTTTALLTMGYLHAKYASLLLLPLQLSADWSFACVPMVEQLTDLRNLATLALYAYLLHVCVAARPWRVLLELLGLSESAAVTNRVLQPTDTALQLLQQPSQAQCSSTAAASTAAATAQVPSQPQGPDLSKPSEADAIPASAADRHARWRFVVAVGLVVAPFFPASNVFFYVGTFIGERLLYFPSIGFCLLLADACMRLGGPAFHRVMLQACSIASRCLDSEYGDDLQFGQGSINHSTPAQAAAAGELKQTGTDSHGSTSRAQHASNDPAAPAEQAGHAGSSPAGGAWWRGAATTLALAALLIAYSWRTVLRNQDWHSEEKLFRAAQKVCWTSAKVQLNSGILERRYMNWRQALEHFELARAIEPGYCEPDYWVGLTLINQGLDIPRGLEELQKAVNCKYVAVEAVKALHKIYTLLHAESPRGALYIKAWAQVLLHPTLNRLEEACEALEQAAVEVALRQPGVDFAGLTEMCLEHLQPKQQQQQVNTGEQPQAGLATLRRCIIARQGLLSALLKQPAAGERAKRATYAYLRDSSACRVTAMLDGGTLVQPASQAHMQLIHNVQAADAEDPWLQREWGEILLAQGRAQEAVRHLVVAGVLLAQLMAEEGFTPAKQAMYLSFLTSGGSNRGGADADVSFVADAALGSFQRCLDVGAADECHVRIQMCDILAKLAAGVQSKGHAHSARTQADAQRRVLQCRQELRLNVQCTQHAAAQLGQNL